jgi:hypothetical protein
MRSSFEEFAKRITFHNRSRDQAAQNRSISTPILADSGIIEKLAGFFRKHRHDSSDAGGFVDGD